MQPTSWLVSRYFASLSLSPPSLNTAVLRLFAGAVIPFSEVQGLAAPDHRATADGIRAAGLWTAAAGCPTAQCGSTVTILLSARGLISTRSNLLRWFVVTGLPWAVGRERTGSLRPRDGVHHLRTRRRFEPPLLLSPHPAPNAEQSCGALSCAGFCMGVDAKDKTKFSPEMLGRTSSFGCVFWILEAPCAEPSSAPAHPHMRHHTRLGDPL